MIIFNDYKNRYYRCLQNIINDIYNGKQYNRNDIFDKLEAVYFKPNENVIGDLAYSGKFFGCKNDEIKLFINSKIPIRANKMELAYLKLLIEDEKFNKILDDKVLKKLNDVLADLEYINYNEYWKRENIDKYGDDLADNNFRNTLLLLQRAIILKRYIKYSSVNRKGEIFKDKIAYPYKIEYSIRNDKYRLIVLSDERAIKINIDSIKDIEILYDKEINNSEIKDIENMIYKKKHIQDPIVLEVENNLNNLDRCFNLFSSYDKKYFYNEDDKLILTIYYYDFDEAEIIKNILSLGAGAVVLGPEKIRQKVIERIIRK